MSTTALDSFDAQAAARPPISLHPAFPAVVALWFSALLGLGSLALPGALLEHAVATTRIVAIIPAAAPPLGFTARVVVALAGALGGALLGLTIARRVARAHARLTIGSNRVLDIQHELGEEALPDGRALEMHAPALEHHDEWDEPDVSNPAAPTHDEREAIESEAAPRVGDDPLGWPERLANAPLSKRDALAGAEDSSSAGARPFEPSGEAHLALVGGTAADEAGASSSTDWAAAPLADLSLVQLAQRLGSSIERRRELIARSVPAQPSVEPVEIEAAPADEAAEAMAAYFGSPIGTGSGSSLEADPLPDFLAPFLTGSRADEEAGNGCSPLGSSDPFAASNGERGKTPGMAGPDADAALRSALATLQRVSGAA